MILDRHDLSITPRTIPLLRHVNPDKHLRIGTDPLGDNTALRFHPECSCGWRVPISADIDRARSDHRLHVRDEA